MRQLTHDARKPLRRTLYGHVAALVLLGLAACAYQTPQSDVATAPATVQPDPASEAADAFVRLDSLFRRAYDEAVEHHRENVVFDAPIIIQDLLNMTLIRANGERARFEMDKSIYFTMARSSHPVIGVISIISMAEGERFSPGQLTTLAEYGRSIEIALAHVDNLPVDSQSRARINTILLSTADYIAEVTDSGIASEEGFKEFFEPLRPLLANNLRVGAQEQLNQFNAQMELWKTENPNDNWDDLRVVILGLHQPRVLYTLTQFFQWLLSEEELKPRIVYAEFQHSFFGEDLEIAQELAIELATKVDLDRMVSDAVFGDETYLESDVMGRGAREIITTWSEADFNVK